MCPCTGYRCALAPCHCRITTATDKTALPYPLSLHAAPLPTNVVHAFIAALPWELSVTVAGDDEDVCALSLGSSDRYACTPDVLDVT